MQDITLKLDAQKISLILSALAELPFRVSAELIGLVQQQAQAQVSTEAE